MEKVIVKKHKFKDLWHLTPAGKDGSLYDDWLVAGIYGKEIQPFVKLLIKLGGRPENTNVLKKEWPFYIIWFKSEADALNAIEYLEAEKLMEKISNEKR